MSICCFMIITILIILSIILLGAIYFFYKKMYITKAINNKNIELVDNRHQNDINDNVHNDEKFSIDVISFVQHDNLPVIRVCRKTDCDYIKFCNIKICKHMINNVKIENDKYTVRNVTYIHLDNCIIVFITNDENVSHKEQELSHEEDINYIKSYTSKFLQVSVYIVYFEKKRLKFKDYRHNEYDEYSILIQPKQITREIDFDEQHLPSAPQISYKQQYKETPLKHKVDNKNAFFYIEK